VLLIVFPVFMLSIIEAACCRIGMSVWMMCPCVTSLWMNRDVMVV
jgi:hypothetical protein